MIVMREAQLVDLPWVLRLYQQVGLDDHQGLTLPQVKAWYEQLQRYPDYRLWVAETEARIVGTFALLIMDNLVHQGSPAGIVEAVAVDSDYQGQGIGRQMMMFAIATCRAAGCYKLMLSSNLKRKDAHQFYEALGFEKHGYSFQVSLS